MTKQIQTFFSTPTDPNHIGVLSKYMSWARNGSKVYVSLFRRDEAHYDRLAEMARRNGASVEVDFHESVHGRRNHNKNFAFEALDDPENRPYMKNNIVVVSSANLHQKCTEKHQCTVRFQSRLLFEAFRDRWREIRDFKTSGTVPEYREARSEGYDEEDPELKVKAYFFPRRDDEDTIAEIIRNVDPSEPGTLQLLWPRFRSARSVVAYALREVAEPGKVTVFVVTRPRGEVSAEGEEHVNFDLQSTLGPRVQYKVCRSSGKTFFHSRYVTISGTYQNRRERIVWMGSPNLTGESIRKSFETLIKVRDKDDEAYREFSANFDMFWNTLARTPREDGTWPDDFRPSKAEHYGASSEVMGADG
jgi:hypothetical protein